MRQHLGQHRQLIIQLFLATTTRTMKFPVLFSKCLVLCLASLATLTISASPSFCQSTYKPPRDEKLLNGLKLLMFDAPSSDKVTLKVRFHSGSAFDPQGKEGLMELLAANIFPSSDAKEYFAEQLGGSLNVESNYDYIQINATAKPDKLVSMLETVANAVGSMQIDKETTAKLKSAQLERIATLEKDPSYIADLAAASRLFGTFPYGRSTEGTIASLGKIDFADLLAAKQRFFTADNTTVVLIGNFDPTAAFRAVRRDFGPWLKADKLAPSTFRQPDDPPSGIQRVDSPTSDRFEVRFITRGTARSSVDFAAYRIAAAIIDSRLKSISPFGSNATINAESIDHVLPGGMIIRVSGPKSAPKIETNDIVMKALSAPVSESEFQSAKQQVVAAIQSGDIYDRWLDVDTFKIDSPSKWIERASAVNISNVNDVLSRIKNQPMTAVVVSSPSVAN